MLRTPGRSRSVLATVSEVRNRRERAAGVAFQHRRAALFDESRVRRSAFAARDEVVDVRFERLRDPPLFEVAREARAAAVVDLRARPELRLQKPDQMIRLAREPVVRRLEVLPDRGVALLADLRIRDLEPVSTFGDVGRLVECAVELIVVVDTLVTGPRRVKRSYTVDPIAIRVYLETFLRSLMYKTI